ncbi:MAG: CDP-glucose 4,6-dehydratase [Chthoniobacterales bacterium]
MFGGVFRDRTVWLSGHTGFKGSWLATWLLELGARVHGFALEPPTQPSLFEQLGLTSRLHSHEIADVRDAAAVEDSIRKAEPDFIFHLAAQSLVRLSYQKPQETYDINVMGTVHVLEALRKHGRPCHAVFVTTDKCYENREWLHAYREEDPLGGYDPYSSSKAAAEIAIAAYRRSFFSPNESSISIASARAGNVVGGGDWALDRIVPDSIRALQGAEPIPVRNKTSTRPWQHVLEPIGGYLTLAAALARSDGAGRGALRSAFNFGPGQESNRTVEEVVREILARWPGQWEDKSDANAPHEAGRLNLAIDKAFHLLDWSPVWNFETTIAQTVDWYRRAEKADAVEINRLTLEQIKQYEADWDDRSKRN